MHCHLLVNVPQAASAPSSGRGRKCGRTFFRRARGRRARSVAPPGGELEKTFERV